MMLRQTIVVLPSAHPNAGPFCSRRSGGGNGAFGFAAMYNHLHASLAENPPGSVVRGCVFVCVNHCFWRPVFE